MIASLSLGDTAKFRMRKMNNAWPEPGTPDGGVDKSVEERVCEVRSSEERSDELSWRVHWAETS